MTTTNPLQFYYNGIRTSSGKLQKAWYSARNGKNELNVITIYKRDYGSFSAEIQEAFKVENDSDGLTDYFEKDRIRVTEFHPLYSVVLEAANKMKAHRERYIAKMDRI